MSHPVDVLCPFSPHTFNSHNWPRGPSHARTQREDPTRRERDQTIMKIKNRAIGLLTTMAVVLVLGSGVALAATTIHCPNDTSKGTPSGYLYCNGTTEADTMVGSDLVDYMLGVGANDTMHGYGGGDQLVGGKGSDHLYGDAGNDSFLWGDAYDGATNTYTDNSDDYVHSGGGADQILGGFAQGGVDRLYAEGGNDRIDASQRQNSFSPVTKEIIDCGAGASDEVSFDKGLDVVKNCEVKHPY
jgi:RTX calcium-binding nonapeptide repeat (4 copies)